MMVLARREFGKIARIYFVRAESQRTCCWTFRSFGNPGIAVLAPSPQLARTALHSAEGDAIQELT